MLLCHNMASQTTTRIQYTVFTVDVCHDAHALHTCLYTPPLFHPHSSIILSTLLHFPSDDIRLVGGHTSELSSNGTVQVYREGRWTDVCGDSAWDVAGAQVVCARLGFNQARVVTWSTARTYSRWMHGVTCVGNESSLLDCSHQIISYATCTSAGVECLNCECARKHIIISMCTL